MPGVSSATPIAFVFTADRERARPFYETTLGLPVISEDPFALSFALADGCQMRLTSIRDHVGTGHTILGWWVDDLPAAMSGLRSAGVRFEVYEGFGQDADGVWTSPDGATRIAWFLDPDGNGLSVGTRVVQASA